MRAHTSTLPPSSGSTPLLRENSIYGGKSGGVSINTGGKATLEKNKLSDNWLAEVEVEAGSHVTMVDNDVTKSKGRGLIVRDKGSAKTMNNRFISNDICGMVAMTGSKIIARSDKVARCGMGVLFQDGSTGIIEDMDVEDNASTGMDITTSSKPRVLRTRICGNQVGVKIREGGRGIFEWNEISENIVTPMEVSTGGEPQLFKNTIKGRSQTAVFTNVHKANREVIALEVWQGKMAVVMKGQKYLVKWIGKAPKAASGLLIKNVEARGGGEVMLSNGQAFENLETEDGAGRGSQQPHRTRVAGTGNAEMSLRPGWDITPKYGYKEVSEREGCPLLCSLKHFDSCVVHAICNIRSIP